MLRAGDLFLGPYPPGSNKDRRIFVLTDEHDGRVVVAFTSTSMTDATTMLEVGDHPAITARCCVIYEKATVVASSVIVTAVAQGALRPQTPLSATLLTKIQEGLFESEDTKLTVVRFATDLV